jgi:uncharacterized CHY-type Zn-finger protein
MKESSNEVFVRGVDVDAQTRCAHWHSPLDIMAIKFSCCGEWYACYECHQDSADHASTVWPKQEFAERAIMCGACSSPISIDKYLCCDSTCPNCGSPFNPGCAKHYDLYFEM